jgi:glycosyltransferase involved in cell wall biosynthesis
MTGGNPQGLARAERRLGLESWSVSFTQNPFGYGADEVLWPADANPLKCEMRRWALLWRALREFDVIHFNFGQSIMPHWVPTAGRARAKRLSRAWRALLPTFRCYARLFELRDLPLLKKAGKGIVVTFQGDDARQGDFCLAHFEVSPATEVEPGYYSEASDSRKRRRIERFASYADLIYALNPDLLHVLPPGAKFLPYSHIDLRNWKPADTSRLGSGVPIVVHAPSNRGVKGTRFVLEAISQLEREGIPVQLVLVEGVQLAEARSSYEQADLVVDQLLCGWYGGLAVEAMALGKPVVSYVRQEDLKFIPKEMREELPIINATPATVSAVLREWLTVRRHELPALGQRSRAYVERWHDPLSVAARLKQDYETIMASKRQDRRV